MNLTFQVKSHNEAHEQVNYYYFFLAKVITVFSLIVFIFFCKFCYIFFIPISNHCLFGMICFDRKVQ